MAEKLFPQPPDEVLPVLEAAAEGRLLVQQCEACGEHQFYPRTICVACGSPDPAYVEASGRGVVHTFTVIHQNRMPGWSDELPYVVAVVDLEEGVRITSNVVDCDPGEVEVGMAVEVTFLREGELTLPRFRPR